MIRMKFKLITQYGKIFLIRHFVRLATSSIKLHLILRDDTCHRDDCAREPAPPRFKAGTRVLVSPYQRLGIVEAYHPILPSGWVYRVVTSNIVELHREEALCRAADA